MKKIVLVFAFLITISFQINAQWFWQNPLPQGNSLNELHFVTPMKAWAVGNKGTILKTTDGGITWDTQNSHTTLTLYSVFFVDTLVGYATGYKGIILKTTDGGLNWNVNLNADRGIMCEVSFFNKEYGFATGIYWEPWGTEGIVYKTTNGGNSWSSSPCMAWANEICFIDSSNVVAVGPSIVRTTDGGVTWNTTLIPGWMRGVDFVDKNNGIIVGDEGIIMKTTNGGVSWFNLFSGTSLDLESISYLDSLNAIIVGEGIILRTSNSGISWFQEINYPALNSVSFVDSYNGIIVGDNGGIIKTTDGGIIWSFQTKGIVRKFTSVCFTNQDVGTVVGDSGTVLVTLNGGSNWELKSVQTKQTLTDVSYADKNNAFIVGYTGTILKTTNGGNSWSSLLSGTTNNLTSVSYVDSEFAVVVGVNIILITTNGGTDWSLQSHTQQLQDVSFIDHNNGLITTYTGFVDRTTDGGLTWISCYNEWPPSGVCLIDSLHGAFSGNYKIWRTTNGGLTWFEQLNQTDAHIYDISFCDINNGIVVGEYGLILRTSDGGDNWVTQQFLSGYTLYGANIFDPNIATVVGAGGTILRTTNGGITFIEDEENNFTQPKDFLLQQNYPNPFNPSTSIQYAISSTQFVTLKIYDLLGREVATLVNEEKPAGLYNAQFTMNNLPASRQGVQLSSGIYFYKLQAGDFIETKKMVLLK